MLAIPPARIDVWIRPHEDGHLQAVGTDTAGRRQYLYHVRRRERRDQQKFDRMLTFARLLPSDHVPRPPTPDCDRRLHPLLLRTMTADATPFDMR
jgi:DNA topoisomerase IB